MAFEKLASKMSQNKLELQAGLTVVEELLSTEKTQVERRERKCATETEKRQQWQQLLVECRETNQAVSRELAEGDWSSQKLRLKVISVAAKRIK